MKNGKKLKVNSHTLHPRKSCKQMVKTIKRGTPTPGPNSSWKSKVPPKKANVQGI